MSVSDLAKRIDGIVHEPTQRHDRTWRNPDEDYQWWHLDGGGYLLEYNESLDGEGSAVLETRDALLRRGAFHPTVRVSDLEPMPLWVSPGGIRLKENARVSTVRPP